MASEITTVVVPSVMEKYTCPTCNSVILNDPQSIKNHNRTIMHRKGIVKKEIVTSEEFREKKRLKMIAYREKRKENIGGTMYKKFKYLQGKIYELYSPRLPNLKYIGSTTTELDARFSKHKSRPNNEHMCKFMNKYSDVVINLIEDYPCLSEDELKYREYTIIKDTLELNGVVFNYLKKSYRKFTPTPLNDILALKNEYPEYSTYFDIIIKRDYPTL